MPIESPVLDDLGFSDIEQLLRSRIPVYAPEWTDHNDSDPGITLIQLFSHLGEQLGYRLNQLPEKNYLEFLKMIGIRLKPAEPALTLINFVLATPENVTQFLIPAGSTINAESDADEPPVFETDRNLDVVPAQLAAMATTRSPALTQINSVSDVGPTAGSEDALSYIDERFSLVWDGKSPKLKDLPTDPITLFPGPSEQEHEYLWLGLAFNPSVTAGFLGSRVNLHVQLDDDEQPAPDARSQCGAAEAEIVDFSAPDDDLVGYQFYRPPQPGESEGTWRDVNIIGDTTQGWTQSGVIRFDVPTRMGAVPDDEWQEVESELLHPLIGALKNPVRGAPELVPASGWIRVLFKAVRPAATIRAISFNTAPATSAVTSINEQLGVGNGRPGQTMMLANPNTFRNSLELVSFSRGADLVEEQWSEVESFDSVGAFDRAYVLDAESGTIAFGDKQNGVPPAVTERLVARSYRHGGGLDNDVPVGLVNAPSALPPAVDAAINIVAAKGGKDAETLLEAKIRAPKEMQSQERVVTDGDFRFHAEQTPQYRVGRAEVVSFHKPYPEGRMVTGTLIPKAGLDFDVRIPGVVSVIVVPDESGLYPTPSKGGLRKVCEYLDTRRLVTTEVYSAPPQYVRISGLDIQMRAETGYTRTQLREAIAELLEDYYHVLNGGEDGAGFPFGATIHHSDLIAQVFKVQGVRRVERLTAMIDGRTPDEAPVPMVWRSERLAPVRLVNCVENENDIESFVLMTDENVFVDSSSVNVRFTGA